MADNVVLNAGAGGATAAADDIGGVHFPRVKIIIGADGVNDGDVSAANPLPTTEASAAAIKTALQIIDDWDESDRAKVNPIVGQAGVAAGAGAVGVTVPRVTLASDDPAVAKLVTIDADTGAIKTAVETIDNAIAGSEMQVDVVAALPAGDNNIGNVDVVTHPADTFVAEDGALGKGVLVQGDDGTDRHNLACDTSGRVKIDIAEQSDAADLKITLDSEAVVLGAGTAGIGKLTANTGVDIGDVDVMSVVPGTSAASLGKAEDAAHSSGDVGIMPLAVREDAANGAPGADGDYVPLTTDADGLLRVLPGVKGTVHHANINGNTSGNNTLVAAAGEGNKIRVLSMLLVAHGNVTVIIEDGAGGDDLSGPYEFDGDNQPKGISLAFSPVGHFVTTANTLLNMALDAAVRVAGHIVYDVVT